MSRLTFPAYRSRYLPALNLARIQALTDREWAPVIISTGAIEQHGPHLPVAVDAFLGEVWVTSVLAALPKDTSCYVGPPVTIGKSNEHTGFPGTLIISKETLRAQVWTIARQLKAWGFGHILIINSHGGNVSVLVYTMREIRAELGLSISFLSSDVSLPLSEQEKLYGFHANEVETALMYATAGSFCDASAAVCHYPAQIGDPGVLRPENSAATFAWASQDLSASGIMGNAAAGTAESGRLWLDACTKGLVASIVKSSAANREAYLRRVRHRV